jgi:pyridoxal phosphate enzyme (YggS family)
MSMNEIAENVARVRGEIAEAAQSAGRAPSEILLVAASKLNDAGRVRAAILAGVDAVGENRVQEMTQKRTEGAYTGAPLHFIGHLQSNKVKNVVGAVELIESAGSAELLARIGARAAELGITQRVLVEVNIGEEFEKSGIPPGALPETLEKASAITGISVLGLMAVPPAREAESEQRRFFDAMMKLFVDMRDKKYDNINMRYISMGMSDSFRAAIRSGANMVRVGSAIFGARRYT